MREVNNEVRFFSDEIASNEAASVGPTRHRVSYLPGPHSPVPHSIIRRDPARNPIVDGSHGKPSIRQRPHPKVRPAGRCNRNVTGI